MIRRTPQEIADFFQCYVAQDESGEWYMYKDKPIRNEDSGIWVGSIEEPLRITYMTVEIPSDHDWTILYEQRPYSEKPADSINKEAFCSGKAPDSENKPDHASEVYIGERFVLLGEFQPPALMQKVEEYLDKGYRLYGNPWTGPDVERCGYIHYQAMVRGV